ncbi:MAG: chemotaxis protein CheB [Chthoniobacterales bacterium]
MAGRELKVVRDIVVIGAPVGGAGALTSVVSSLPPDLPATVLVVLHARPDKPILLADALSAPGRLRVTEAIDGEPLAPRRIYVAADGKHLRIRNGLIRLEDNAGESACCPSVDELFRSAAEEHRERVVGVALVHVDDEGSIGLASVRRNGGRTITHRNEQMQDPPRDSQNGDLLSHHHLELAQVGPRIVAYVHGKNGVEEHR